MQKFFRILALVALLTGCTAAGVFDPDDLQGQWTSLEDAKSAIEFTDQEKIDTYDGVEVSRGDFTLSENGSLTVVDATGNLDYEISELTDKSLVLIFKPRGNLLHYTK